MTDLPAAAPPTPGDSSPGEQPTSGRIEAGAHVLPVRVYYEDTDFTGLVYHARYLQFLERGRSDFLRLLGVEHARLLERPEPLVFAVRRMVIDYLSPARIDDALQVRSQFKEARGARLTIEQGIERAGATLVTAEVEAVCMTLDGKPRRAPKDIAERFAAVAASAG